MKFVVSGGSGRLRLRDGGHNLAAVGRVQHAPELIDPEASPSLSSPRGAFESRLAGLKGVWEVAQRHGVPTGMDTGQSTRTCVFTRGGAANDLHLVAAMARTMSQAQSNDSLISFRAIIWRKTSAHSLN